MDSGSRALKNLIPVGRYFRPVFEVCPTPKPEGMKSAVTKVFKPKPVMENLYVPMPSTSFKKKIIYNIDNAYTKKSMVELPKLALSSSSATSSTVPTIPLIMPVIEPAVQCVTPSPAGKENKISLKDDLLNTPPLPESPKLPRVLEELFNSQSLSFSPSTMLKESPVPLAAPLSEAPIHMLVPPKLIESTPQKPLDPLILFKDAPSTFLNDSMSKIAQLQNKEAKTISDLFIKGGLFTAKRQPLFQEVDYIP
jgi:hypothetical protein